MVEWYDIMNIEIIIALKFGALKKLSGRAQGFCRFFLCVPLTN